MWSPHVGFVYDLGDHKNFPLKVFFWGPSLRPPLCENCLWEALLFRSSVEKFPVHHSTNTTINDNNLY